ncbi:MAG TPA: oligoendopeptidase F, partial [Ktedonobacteraceae bacterium]|nr:oligoendopeptidase F [Ktedonobacteraceae bacterium]
MQALKNRTDIPTEFTWNLQSIFASNEDWERTFKSLQQRLPELESLQGTLAQSGEALLTVLQKRDEIYKQLEHLYVYASMRRDEDTTNSTYQGMADRAMQLYVQISTVASYIEPEILAIPEATLEQFFKETPGLELYRQQLDDLSRKRGHVRSAEIEAVLAAAGEMAEAPGSIFTMIDNADLKLPVIKNEAGEEVELTKGNYEVFRKSTDRRVRKEAFEFIHKAYLNQRNTIAATLGSQMKADI